MANPLVSIACFTLVEARRTRVGWIAAAALAAILLLAQLAAALAITDSLSYRAGVYAGLARPALVLIVVLFVASSVVRELQDRMLDLTLSRPVSRASWYLGRLAGFGLCAVALAVAAALPLPALAPAAAVVAWSASLAAELWLMAALCLACSVTLRQVTPAVSASAAFYVLARAIDAMVLMSRGPAVDPAQWPHALLARGVALVAVLLPSLDRFTQSAWLIHDAARPHLLPIAVETLVFSAVLVAIGLFDLYRLDD